MAYMDHLIGRIVKKTEDLGITEETLILVTGDNGTHKSLTSKLGDRVIQGGKGLTTDAGTRVALVGLWPGAIQAGTVCDDLVDFFRFPSNHAGSCQCPNPERPGWPEFPAPVEGWTTGTTREWLYCYYNSRPERTEPARFVRNQRWKLYGDGRFYDVANDVLEKSPIQPSKSERSQSGSRKIVQSTRFHA